MSEKHIDIKFLANGYVVTYQGFLKNNGQRVYKFNEELAIAQDIAEKMLDKKVEAREK